MNEKKLGRKVAWKKARKIIRRETTVLLILGFSFAGALTASTMIQSILHLDFVDPKLFSGAVSIIALPQIFMQVKDNQEPVLIKLARAFRGGFSASLELAPDFSEIVAKVRLFWKNLHTPI